MSRDRYLHNIIRLGVGISSITKLYICCCWVASRRDFYNTPRWLTTVPVALLRAPSAGIIIRSHTLCVVSRDAQEYYHAHACTARCYRGGDREVTRNSRSVVTYYNIIVLLYAREIIRGNEKNDDSTDCARARQIDGKERIKYICAHTSQVVGNRTNSGVARDEERVDRKTIVI